MTAYERAREEPTMYLESLEVPYCIDEFVDSNHFATHLDNLRKKGVISQELFDSAIKHVLKNTKYLFYTLCPETHFGKGIPQKVFVLRPAFDLPEPEFLSGLYDHEFIHAEDNYKGIETKAGRIDHKTVGRLQAYTLLAVKEIRAYTNQADKLVAKELTDNYTYLNCLIGRAMFADMLENIDPQNPFEAAVRKEYLALFRNTEQ